MVEHILTMIKCFIYKGVPMWCSFVETKWFWSRESAQRYCDRVCPQKWGQDKYFFVISK